MANTIGDPSRPRHVCIACRVVEYTPLRSRADNPWEVSRRKAERRCAKGPGCEVIYQAGIQFQGPACGQARAEKNDD